MSWIFQPIVDAIKWATIDWWDFIVQRIMWGLYQIWYIISRVVDIFEDVFYILVGLEKPYGSYSPNDPISQGIQNSPPNTDIASIIIRDSRVQTAFQNIMIIAIVLLLFFTILKIIQEQYKNKDGGNPYIIVFRMFKGLITMLLVTAAVFIGFTASGYVLRALQAAINGSGSSIAGEIFNTMAYNANRYRLGSDAGSDLFGGQANRELAYKKLTNTNSPVNHLTSLFTDNMYYTLEQRTAGIYPVSYDGGSSMPGFTADGNSPEVGQSDVGKEYYPFLDTEEDGIIYFQYTYKWREVVRDGVTTGGFSYIMDESVQINPAISKLYVNTTYPAKKYWYTNGESNSGYEANYDTNAYPFNMPLVSLSTPVTWGDAGDSSWFEQGTPYYDTPQKAYDAWKESIWTIIHYHDDVEDFQNSFAGNVRLDYEHYSWALDYSPWFLSVIEAYDEARNPLGVVDEFSVIVPFIVNYKTLLTREYFDKRVQNFEHIRVEDEGSMGVNYDSGKIGAAAFTATSTKTPIVQQAGGNDWERAAYVDNVMKNPKSADGSGIYLHSVDSVFSIRGLFTLAKNTVYNWTVVPAKTLWNWITGTSVPVEKADVGTWIATSMGQASYQNSYAIEVFYEIRKFDFIIGFIGLFIVLGVFLNFMFGLIQRLLELAVLYVMSPVTLAMYPFDDGESFSKNFVGPFYKKVISVYAVVLSINLFFVLYRPIKDIKFFNDSARFAGIPTPGALWNMTKNMIMSVIMMTALVGLLPKVRTTIQEIFGAQNIDEKGIGQMFKDAGGAVWNDSMRTIANQTGRINQARRAYYANNPNALGNKVWRWGAGAVKGTGGIIGKGVGLTARGINMLPGGGLVTGAIGGMARGTVRVAGGMAHATKNNALTAALFDNDSGVLMQGAFGKYVKENYGRMEQKEQQKKWAEAREKRNTADAHDLGLVKKTTDKINIFGQDMFEIAKKHGLKTTDGKNVEKMTDLEKVNPKELDRVKKDAAAHRSTEMRQLYKKELDNIEHAANTKPGAAAGAGAKARNAALDALVTGKNLDKVGFTAAQLKSINGAREGKGIAIMQNNAGMNNWMDTVEKSDPKKLAEFEKLVQRGDKTAVSAFMHANGGSALVRDAHSYMDSAANLKNAATAERDMQTYGTSAHRAISGIDDLRKTGHTDAQINKLSDAYSLANGPKSKEMQNQIASGTNVVNVNGQKVYTAPNGDKITGQTDEELKTKTKDHFDGKYNSAIKTVNAAGLANLDYAVKHQERLEGAVGRERAEEGLKMQKELMNNIPPAAMKEMFSSQTLLQNFHDEDKSGGNQRIAEGLRQAANGDIESSIFAGDQNIERLASTANGRASLANMSNIFGGLMGDPNGMMRGDFVFNADNVQGFLNQMAMDDTILKSIEGRIQMNDQSVTNSMRTCEQYGGTMVHFAKSNSAALGPDASNLIAGLEAAMLAGARGEPSDKHVESISKFIERYEKEVIEKAPKAQQMELRREFREIGANTIHGTMEAGLRADRDTDALNITKSKLSARRDFERAKIEEAMGGNK